MLTKFFIALRVPLSVTPKVIERKSTVSDKLSTKSDSSKMTAIAPDDARQFVRTQLEDIARTRRPGESVKAMLGRVSRDVGLGFSKVRRYWYGEIDNIPWHEAETIRQRAQQVRERWELMQRRQRLAAEITELKRTEEYGAEVARRREDSRRAHLDGNEAEDAEPYLFWLGRPDNELDREGGE